jgi:phenylalanyl-tRNA synthetase alpha chain
MALEELDAYRDAALASLTETPDAGLEGWHRQHLAPSGEANQFKRQIGKQPKDQRRAFGQAVNVVSKALSEAFAVRLEAAKAADLRRRLEEERVDVTLPARPVAHGGLHPSVVAMRQVIDVFAMLGFSVFESPHVETDFYNFEAANMPPHHPARDMQDTFFTTEDQVLRTHTTSGQVRAMRTLGPGPIRVVLPGLCYRNEDVTTRSEMQFHQIEGLLVGENVRMSDLKGVLMAYARAMFGEDQDVRMRGSYFPFTEPSVEVDIRCTLCGGEGCRVCKYTGWLEIGGAGQVHPVVLRHGGYDPSAHRGIAFGLGIERTLMLRHGIDDIRHFFKNDVRFLAHFR